MEDPEQLAEGETEPSDSISEASDGTDTTGESWENVGLPSENDDEEMEEAAGQLEEFVPPSEPLQVQDGPSDNQEILGLCRSQSVMQYVLLTILSVVLLRGIAQPNIAELDAAQYLRLFKAELQPLLSNCSSDQDLQESLRWHSERRALCEDVELPRLRRAVAGQAKDSRDKKRSENTPGASRSDSEDMARLQELLQVREAQIRFLEESRQKSHSSAAAAEAELRQQVLQLQQEAAHMREREAEVAERFEKLRDSLQRSERLRRAEDAEWKQKHERVRAELESLKHRMRDDHTHPSWIHQVEDFGQRMSEEWRRHAPKGHPFIGEWLEHARKETAEVTEKLRKKYKKARDRGHEAACRFSRRWGFKGCK